VIENDISLENRQEELIKNDFSPLIDQDFERNNNNLKIEISIQQDDGQQKQQHMQLISPQSTMNSKAIAICLVLLGHILVYRGRNAIPHSIYPLFRFATLAVGAFAFLSGYGLTKSVERSGLDGFFLKRFSTVYIPFAVTAIGFTSLFQNLFHSWIGVENLLKSLTLFFDPASTIDGTLWFVTFICGWYILFYIVFKIFENKHQRVIVMFIVGFTAYIALSKDYGYWRLTDLYTNQMFQIPFGVFFATYENNRFIQKYLKEKKIHIPLLIIHTALIGIIYWKYIFLDVYDKSTPKTKFFNFMQTIINILFGVWVPVICTLYINKSYEIMNFLGGHSYEAYLLEGIFIHRIKFSRYQPDDGLLFFFVTFSCAFAFKRVYQIAINYTVSFINTTIELLSSILKRRK